MTVAETIQAHGGILVAHDGSDAAQSALRTAAALSGSVGGSVTAVRAWTMATSPRPASWTTGYVPPLAEFEAATLDALGHAVALVQEEFPDVTISSAAVHGRAADKLIEASEHVDLIVVGSRGRGGFTGLLLGSVSEQVVRHARCPVLVDRGSGLHQSGSAGDQEPLERALLSELGLDDPIDQSQH